MKIIKRSKHLFGKALLVYRHEGFGGLCRGLKRYKKFLETSTPEAKRIILDGKSYFYDFVNNFNPADVGKFISISLDIKSKLTINWIVPDYKIGSGGHMTIFRTIHYLEKFGHKNRIYLYDTGTGLSYRNAEEARRIIVKNFIKMDAEVFLGIGNIEDSDILVATSWHTAYPVFNINNTKKKFYFVQDYEPDFYPVSSENIFSEQTYKMGFKCITAGPWLSKIMKEKYGNMAEHFWLAYDKNIYRNNNKIKRKDNKIIFYGRFVTPRRGFELGILALNIVKKERPDVEIGIFGWDVSNQQIPFKYKNYGILNSKELADLYSESAIGVVFSMTNYSLIPQEMMACGLPVVELSGESTREIFIDGKNVILAEKNPYDIAKKIIKLLDDCDSRQKIAKNAHDWVNKFDWEKSALIVQKSFYEL